MTDHSEETEQFLDVRGFSLLTAQVDNNEPIVQVLFDVQHTETKMQWKQSLQMTTTQIRQLIELLEFYEDNQP